MRQCWKWREREVCEVRDRNEGGKEWREGREVRKARTSEK